jgi:hypothetical protein
LTNIGKYKKTKQRVAKKSSTLKRFEKVGK